MDRFSKGSWGVLVVTAFTWLLAAPAPGTAQGMGSPSLEEELAAVKAATERFRDVEVALAEGYIPDPMNMCERAESMGFPPEDGAMGIHYLRPDLLQITGTEPRVAGMGTHTDFLQPSVLLYEPQEDGSLELVGVENVVFAKPWREAGNTEPPSFAEVPYDYMENDPATEVDEAHMFEPHYDLHVWLFRENPKGMFSPFNPAVTCAHHTNGGHHGDGEGAGHGGHHGEGERESR